MEKWIVFAGIWMMTALCLVLFVRGASPKRNRALALARVRSTREAAASRGDAGRSGVIGER